MDYAGLRDDVVAPLITQFGRTATLRHETKTYVPATGIASVVNTDVAVRIVELSTKHDQRLDSEVERWDSAVLVSALETAVASFVPVVGDIVIVGSSYRRVVFAQAVSPAGIDVVYKLGVVRA